MNILIVDDDVGSRQFVHLLLTREGRQALMAEDAAQALALAARGGIDVIISDWMMPDIDGLELCRQIRNLQVNDYIYFILVTAAEDSHANHLLAMDAGVDDFLAKPIDPIEMRIRLKVAERILGFTHQLNWMAGKLLTICSYTKQIKVSEEDWVPMEKFFGDHLGVRFSHGVAPHIAKQLIDELNRKSPNPNPNRLL